MGGGRPGPERAGQAGYGAHGHKAGEEGGCVSMNSRSSYSCNGTGQHSALPTSPCCVLGVQEIVGSGFGLLGVS